MYTISETGLIDLVGTKAVKRLNIIRQANGKYQIIVTMAWKEGDRTLVTTRGNPREWASLDRLVRHMNEKHEGILPSISLTLSV